MRTVPIFRNNRNQAIRLEDFRTLFIALAEEMKVLMEDAEALEAA